MKSLNVVLVTLLTGFILSFLVIGCANRRDSAQDIDLAKNEQMREEAFQQILNNQNLLKEFMNTMMQNQSAMQWMMGNGQMMQQMFSDNNLHYMMEQNGNMRNHIMQNMMNIAKEDTTFTRQWNNMMRQQMGMGHMN